MPALTEVSTARAYGEVVAGALHRTPEPLFASEPLTGVSRRCAPLPTSFEVAPVVAAYLRQVGDVVVPPQIEALLAESSPAVAPAARSRETFVLVVLAVLLFIVAFAVAFAVLPRALG